MTKRKPKGADETLREKLDRIALKLADKLLADHESLPATEEVAAFKVLSAYYQSIEKLTPSGEDEPGGFDGIAQGLRSHSNGDAGRPASTGRAPEF